MGLSFEDFEWEHVWHIFNSFCSVCGRVSAFGKVSKFVCVYFYHAFVWYFVWYLVLLLCVCVHAHAYTLSRNVTEVCDKPVLQHLTHRFHIDHMLLCLLCQLSNARVHVFCMWPCVKWVCAAIACVGVARATGGSDALWFTGPLATWCCWAGSQQQVARM